MIRANEGIGTDLACFSGPHTCLFFHQRSEQLAQTVPFIQRGLANHERCILVVGQCVRDIWADQLTDAGLDVAALEAKADLAIWTQSDWRLPGDLNSIRMARHVWASLEDSLDSHSGMRMIIDATWTLGVDPVPAASLCHLEATLDHVFTPDLPVRVMCQYNRQLLSSSALHAGLRTHPFIMVDGYNTPNPVYEAPDILQFEPDRNACSEDRDAVDRMIDHLIPVR